MAVSAVFVIERFSWGPPRLIIFDFQYVCARSHTAQVVPIVSEKTLICFPSYCLKLKTTLALSGMIID